MPPTRNVGLARLPPCLRCPRCPNIETNITLTMKKQQESLQHIAGYCFNVEITISNVSQAMLLLRYFDVEQTEHNISQALCASVPLCLCASVLFSRLFSMLCYAMLFVMLCYAMLSMLFSKLPLCLCCPRCLRAVRCLCGPCRSASMLFA